MNMKNICLGLAIVTVSCGAAFAMPQNAEGMIKERFDSMDADKNGLVSKEEFLAAMPNMTEGAFTTIDKDGSGDITFQEWNEFSIGHAKDQMQGMRPAGDEAPAEGTMKMPARKAE